MAISIRLASRSAISAEHPSQQKLLRREAIARGVSRIGWVQFEKRWETEGTKIGFQERVVILVQCSRLHSGKLLLVATRTTSTIFRELARSTGWLPTASKSGRSERSNGLALIGSAGSDSLAISCESRTTRRPGEHSHRQAHAQSLVPDVQLRSAHEASKYAQIPGPLCHLASSRAGCVASGDRQVASRLASA